MASLSLSLVSVVGLLLLSVRAPAAIVRPSNIRFAFYRDLDSGLYDFDAVQQYVGLQAAMKEVNDANVVDGVTLEVVHYPAPSGLSNDSTLLAAALAVANRPEVFGFVAPDYGSSAYVRNVSQSYFKDALPIVAGRGMQSDNGARSDMRLRQPIASEFLMMLRYAMSNPDVRCTAFTLVKSAVVPFDMVHAASILAGMRFPAPIEYEYGSSPLNVTDLLNTWAAGSAATKGYMPMCGLFFTPSADFKAILEQMYTDGRFDMNRMRLYGGSLASEGVFNSSAHGMAPFKSVRFATNFQAYDSPTDPLSMSYRAALSAWLPSYNASMLPAAMRVVDVMHRPTYPGLEGYLAGRWIATMLAGMPSLTPSLFVDAAYGRVFTFVNDTALGPFADHCQAAGSVTGLPCQCHVATSTMYMSEVSLETGLAQQRPATVATAQALRKTLPLSECYLTESSFEHPAAIAIWNADQSNSSAAAPLVALYQLLAVKYNDAGTMPTVFMSTTLMNAQMPLPVDEGELYATRRPLVVISSDRMAPSFPIANFLSATSADLEDEPLTPPVQYSRFALSLTPVLADLTQGLAKQLGTMYGKGGRRFGRQPLVYVAAEGAALSRLATLSLHTMQFPIAGGGAINFSDGTSLAAVFREAAAAAASGVDAVVFVASRTDAGVTAAVNTATQLTAQYEGAAGSAVVFDHLVVAIATEQSALLAAKLQMVNTSSLPYFPILFPSYFTPYWQPNNAHRARLSSLLSTSATAALESPSYYLALMLFELIADGVDVTAEGTRPTAAALIDWMYSQSSHVASGVPLGPVYDANCSEEVIVENVAQRTCQCYKLLRAVYVYDYRDWLMNTGGTYDPMFLYQMPGCAVEYKALVEATQLNVALVAGIAAPCGAAAVLWVLYMAVCFGRRSNRAAPKSAELPFAMVFTDIQSSTSLWARAPEHMGEALEKHHAALRRLIGRHDGYEVKTIGDSFMVAFKQASDAAAFALEVQTRLFAESWPPEVYAVYVALAEEAYEELLASQDPLMRADDARGTSRQWADAANYALHWNGIRVRVGMHWGVGSVKFDAVSQGYDYYGTLVNTAARVEGVGNGGQVLATKDMYSQLEAEGFDFCGVDVRPLGPQPLRGLDQPVPLYQLCPLTLRGREFAALRLDVENSVDDSSDGTTHSSSQGGDASPEAMLERLLRKKKHGAEQAEGFWRIVNFLSTLLRTSPMSWRQETVRRLLKKWHVHERRGPAGEDADVTLMYDLVALTVQAGTAAEEVRRVDAQQSKSAGRRSSYAPSLSSPQRLATDLERITSINGFGDAAPAGDVES
jgi:class 3 adenylate cyclase